MAQWTLDSKVVDGFWQGFDVGGPMFPEPMACNREELFSLFVGEADWRVFKNQDSAGVSVLVNGRRPGVLLVVWRVQGYASATVSLVKDEYRSRMRSDFRVARQENRYPCGGCGWCQGEAEWYTLAKRG